MFCFCHFRHVVQQPTDLQRGEIGRDGEAAEVLKTVFAVFIPGEGLQQSLEERTEGLHRAKQLKDRHCSY